VKSFFIFFSILSSIVHAGTADENINCLDGKIRTFENNKEVIQNDRYCYDIILRSITSTKKCEAGCEVDSLKTQIIKRSELKTAVSSPQFKICEKFHGVPQEIEYWASHKWIKTSRCLYSDGSYQDIERLISSRVRYED
jgi:hypothetical protein